MDLKRIVLSTSDLQFDQLDPSMDGNRLSPASPPSIIPNVISISPLPDFRRDSSCSAEINLESLPVPKEFADSRHGSFAETGELEK